MVTGGINANRWRSYIHDIFKVVRPGGWCQMVEIYPNAQSDNGTLERGKSSVRSKPGLYADARNNRQRPLAMVKQLPGGFKPLQGPARTSAAGYLDEKCRIH